MATGVRRDAVEQVRILLAIGREQNNAQQPAAALGVLRRARDRALAVGPDAEGLLGRILLSIAASQFELRSFDAALSALADADAIARRIDDTQLQTLIRAQRGFIMVRAGRMDEALTELDAAIAARVPVTALARCNMLLSRGNVQLNRGVLGAARRDLQAALVLAREARSRLAEFQVKHNLGYLEFLGGNLPLALQLMDEVLQTDADLPRGIPLLDRARVLAEAGLTREADETLAEAGAIFLRDRMVQDLAEVELARAECALVAGDADGTRRLAGSARTRFRRRGNVRWGHVADLLLLEADLADGRGNLGMAARAADLANSLRADGHRVWARVAVLVSADFLTRAGRVAEANSIVAEVARTRRSDPISVRLQTRYVAAQISLAEGDAARGSRIVRAGLSELTRYRASFGSIDLQTASAVHGQRLVGLDLSLALRSGRAAAVFAAGERGRAVSRRLPPVHPPLDDVSAGWLAELRQLVEQLRSVDLDRAGTAPMLARRRQLERQIAARSWSVAGAGSAQRPVGLAELRASLTKHDTTLAYYVEVDGVLHSVTVRGGRTRLQSLGDAAAVTELVRRGRADLDALSYQYLATGLRAAVAGSLARTLQTLDAMLLAPLRVGDSRLLVVPTGTLGALPWSSLPSTRGVPVVVAPSATAWHRSTVSAAGAPPRVVAVAGPRLARAADEVTRVGKIWGDAVVRSGDDATGRSLIDALTSSTVVHIAAHGRHSTENPLFSSLQLADGPVFAHELDQAGELAEHVVLSACELGLATIRPGDEALGLTSVLLHLGSRSVVAGVARVGDDLAADTMLRYHERLAAGRDSALALAEALADSGEPATAPFVCFGGVWSR